MHLDYVAMLDHEMFLLHDQIFPSFLCLVFLFMIYDYLQCDSTFAALFLQVSLCVTIIAVGVVSSCFGSYSALYEIIEELFKSQTLRHVAIKVQYTYYSTFLFLIPNVESFFIDSLFSIVSIIVVILVLFPRHKKKICSCLMYEHSQQYSIANENID